MLRGKKYDDAIDFIRKSFGMVDPNWTTNYGGEAFANSNVGAAKYANTLPNPFSEVPEAATAFSDSAFKSASSLKATVTHEFGHFKSIIKDPLSGRWIWPENENAMWNYFDGTAGYLNEIKMASRMHISASEFRGGSPIAEGNLPYLTQGHKLFENFKPNNPVWYSNMIRFKFFRTIPIRYVFGH
jgi:hypothetical protein